MDNVDEKLLAAEIKSATYEGISEKDLAESMLMTARTMVEKEPNYSYVTARLLLNNMENEVCGFLMPTGKVIFEYYFLFKLCTQFCSSISKKISEL